MTETKHTQGVGDVRITYQVLGQGPVVMLVHGFLSSGQMNWVAPGIAAALVASGYRVIIPDLRGHGQSGAPDYAAAYPPDVLALDMEAVLAAESPRSFYLVGYSLGARTAVRMVVRGQQPAKLVLGGMGLSGILDTSARRDFFISAIENRDSLKRGDPGYAVARFLKSTETDPRAAIHVLRSQVNSSLENLHRISVPTLVIAGSKDRDNGSACDLAAAIPHALHHDIDGDHMSAVVNPHLATEIVKFIQN